MIDALGIVKMGVPAAFRGGSIVLQKVNRMRRIDEAIKGIETSDLLQTATRDFEIVKGSWRGEFTETVDRFLRHLEETGLAHTIMLEALVGRNSDAVRQAFIGLFVSQTNQSEQNAEALYRQISVSFGITSRFLLKDPVIADYIKASTGSILDSISRVENAVDHLCAAFKSKPDNEVIADLVPKIIRASINEFKVIRVETSQGRRDVEISKIYIAPRLTFRDQDKLNISRKAITDSIDAHHGPHSDYNSLERIKRSIEALSSVSIEEVSTASRIVVLGDPGGGKSTLLQSICHTAAAKSQKSIQEGENPNNAFVPIRVVLREFEKARVATPQLSIFDYICNAIPSSAFVDKMILPSAMNYLLSSGKVLLAFDGLDEILRTAQRRTFVDIVTKFADQYPLCPVVITSRLIGYDKAPMPEGQFEELVLGDFHDGDVKLYATKFIKNVGRKKVAEARSSAERFMAQTADNASDLRKNPLMLGLMMWIFNIRDDVPSSRPEVYQECARLMFERWDFDRDIIVDIPQTFDRLQVFSYLASRIFGSEEHAGGVSSAWIEGASKAYLSEVLESRSEAHAAAQSLVKFIIDRSWVMSEKGEDVFSFTHQTFLEYFFAKHIDDEYDTIDYLFDCIMPHVREEEWDVVSRLALQIKTHRNRRKEDEAINLIVRDLESDELSDPQLVAVALFAARSLEFLVGSESKIRALVTSILDVCLRSYEMGTQTATVPVQFLFSGARERREFVGGVVIEYLQSCFEKGTSIERDFVVACVDGRVHSYSLVKDAAIFSGVLPEKEALRARLSLRRVLRKESAADKRSAKLLFEWFGIVTRKTITRYGLDFLVEARPRTDYDLDGITAIVIAASGKYTLVLGASGITRRRGEKVLHMIGEHVLERGVSSLASIERQNHLNTPPLHLWVDMVKALPENPLVRLGALVGFYAELLNSDRHSDIGRAPNKSIASMENVIKSAVALDDEIYKVAISILKTCEAIVRSRRDAGHPNRQGLGSKQKRRHLGAE